VDPRHRDASLSSLSNHCLSTTLRFVLGKESFVYFFRVPLKLDSEFHNSPGPSHGNIIFVNLSFVLGRHIPNNVCSLRQAGPKTGKPKDHGHGPKTQKRCDYRNDSENLFNLTLELSDVCLKTHYTITLYHICVLVLTRDFREPCVIFNHDDILSPQMPQCHLIPLIV